VIVLYGVSAIFALLSLFLLWPTGSTLGLVLAVLGSGIWIGVQHLGYLEFGEIRRVAQRTIEQRHIFVNNLAIRRATEELKVADSFEQISRILSAAFHANDFDAFELRTEELQMDELRSGRSFHLMDNAGQPSLRWRKPGSFADLKDTWSISLSLVSASSRSCGKLTVFRSYAGHDLQFDINLLTSAFAPTLAEALQRTGVNNLEFLPARQGSALLPAQAG
jgi:hypothetical protein